jgi:hypothetical protein
VEEVKDKVSDCAMVLFLAIAFNNAIFVFGFSFTEIDEFSIYPH